MQVPADQPFVPVITGGDVGAYSLAREFHEAYGVISAVVPTSLNGNVKHSAILASYPAGLMTDESRVLGALRSVGEELTDQGGNPRPLLLLASYDHLVRFAVSNREELSRWYVIPYPETELIDCVADKSSFYAHCQRLGIPHPGTIDYDVAEHDEATMDHLIDRDIEGAGLRYPLVVKAADSAVWAAVTFEGRQKVHAVQSGEQFRGLLASIHQAGYRGRLIIQEQIPGPDSQMRVATLFREQGGRIALSSVGEVILEDHAPGLEGNSRAVLTSADEEIEAHAGRFLDAVGWTGFGMFDVKVDPRDGQGKFFEMNPRLGRNHYYLTAGGANPARILFENYLRDRLPAATAATFSAGPASERPGEALPTSTRPGVLNTTLPVRLVRRYADENQQRLIDEAVSSGKVHRPFVYSADGDLRRRLYHFAVAVKSYREFRNVPLP